MFDVISTYELNFFVTFASDECKIIEAKEDLERILEYQSSEEKESERIFRINYQQY